MEDFLLKIAEILEVESVTAETRFRDAGDWNSLKGFSLLVFFSQEYGKEMTVSALAQCNTVGDLAKSAGIE